MKWQDFDYEEWKKENEKFDHQEFDQRLERAKKESTLNGLLKVSSGPSPPFKPNAYYNQDGDQIEAYFSDDASYSRWLAPGIDLLLSQETHEVVGVKIAGVKRMIQRFTHPKHKW